MFVERLCPQVCSTEVLSDLLGVLSMSWLPAGAFEVPVPARFRRYLKQIPFDWYKKENRLTKTPETNQTFPLWHLAKGNNP